MKTWTGKENWSRAHTLLHYNVLVNLIGLFTGFCDTLLWIEVAASLVTDPWF